MTSSVMTLEKYAAIKDIDTMHDASGEWITEINHMKDEASFLDALLQRNTRHHFPTITSTQLAEQLRALHYDTLPVLKKKLEEHEQGLADAIDTHTPGRQKGHSETHYQLEQQMKVCRKRYWELKKRIYAYISRKF